MSKIIYLSTPAHGHVNPTLPVATELTRRGEQIFYYNTEDFRPQIERTGATFRAYPHTELTAHAMADSVKDGNLANSSVLMVRATESLLPFILSELEREKPDLVIFDSLAVWGKMATTMLKQRAAASISHFVFDLKTGRITLREILALIWQALPQVPQLLAARSRLISRYGKAAFPPSNPLFPMRDNMNIVFTARTLQPNMALIDDTFRFVGPSITTRANESEPIPSEIIPPEIIPSEIINAQDERQLVYISLGTIHNTQSEFYRQCFAAFANHPAHFILSAGKETNIEALGPIPTNFTVRNFVPQLEVLQKANVFITHGGMNSIHEGLYYAVPLIVIPHQFEQLLNARCIEARGAAFVLDMQVAGKSVQAAELRAALAKVQSEPSYQLAAGELQRELHATGGYRQAADEIQSYIAEGKKTQ